MIVSTTGQVGVALADLRGAPDDSAELVSQALLGTPLTVLEEQTGADGRAWRHVRLPDYKGWMHTSAIVRPAAGKASGPPVRIAAVRTDLRLLDPAGWPGEQALTAY